MGYEWLIDFILGLHFLYLAYVVLGGFLAWRWPKMIWPHLAALIWGVLIVASLVNCPLTWAENEVRARAGQPPLTGGFVDRYVENVIYPERYVNEARVLIALIVLVSWIGAYVRWRRRPTKRVDTSPNDGEEPGRTITV